MNAKPNQFVEDFEDLPQGKTPAAEATAETVLPPATSVAQVPAPAPTNPAPTQQPGPAPTPVPPTTPTVTASDAAAVAEVEDAPTHASSAKPNVDEFDVDFGDEKLMSKSDGLDIARPEKGRTIRFALLTNYLKAKSVHNHYIEKKGTFHCLSTPEAPGICCQKLGESQPQIVALVLQYTNANPKTGRYDKIGNPPAFPPMQWEIKFIRLSRSAFRRVSNLAEEEGTSADIDIAMCHRDSGIGYEYTKLSPARWRRNPELVKEVEAAVKPFMADGGKKLLSKLGKKISVLQFKAVLAGSAPSDEADLSQVDDI
jgi:hypothetical protein